MKTENKINSLLFFRKDDLIKFIIILQIFFLQTGCNNNTIIYAERKDIVEVVYVSGKILPENEHSILAMNNGTVSKKFVDDGDTITDGKVLYILNNLTGGTTSIKSDCDCLIYQATKQEGETVREKELLALTGGSKRIAVLSVDQSDISRIKTGQMVLLKTDLTGDSIYEGSVKKIYLLMNDANQTFRVDVELKQNLDLPFIHNTADGNIVIQKKEKALVVPTNAILNGDSIYIEQTNTEKKIKITPGIRDIDFTEVLSGVDEKTRIIIK